MAFQGPPGNYRNREGLMWITWGLQGPPGKYRDSQGYPGTAREKNRDSQGKTGIAREFKGHPRSSRDSQVTAVEL